MPLSFLRLSPAGDPPADHCQGQRSSATIVIVVSRQFDKVLVEQNHCQGLRSVTSNCDPISQSCFLEFVFFPAKIFDAASWPWRKNDVLLSTTRANPSHRCESLVSKCKNRRWLPQWPVRPWGWRRGVLRSWRRRGEGRWPGNRRPYRPQQIEAGVTRSVVGIAIPAGKRKKDAISVLFSRRTGSPLSGCGDDTRSTYPGYPGALLLAKGNLPCGLQRLKEFIWLEEGAKGKGIENAKGDQKEEDVGGRG